jgi:hypothetical protein
VLPPNRAAALCEHALLEPSASANSPAFIHTHTHTHTNTYTHTPCSYLRDVAYFSLTWPPASSGASGTSTSTCPTWRATLGRTASAWRQWTWTGAGWTLKSPSLTWWVGSGGAGWRDEEREEG